MQCECTTLRSVTMKGLLNKRLMQGPLYKHPTTTCMTFIFVIGKKWHRVLVLRGRGLWRAFPAIGTRNTMTAAPANPSLRIISRAMTRSAGRWCSKWNSEGPQTVTVRTSWSMTREMISGIVPGMPMMNRTLHERVPEVERCDEVHLRMLQGRCPCCSRRCYLHWGSKGTWATPPVRLLFFAGGVIAGDTVHSLPQCQVPLNIKR
mmetsp:Transcript_10211/g.15641  ORF Transcript_10211/g.15641 Transcript_10211/m.15641 type:complete len:205 (+) Transcript_10211:444-1058(+)